MFMWIWENVWDNIQADEVYGNMRIWEYVCDKMHADDVYGNMFVIICMLVMFMRIWEYVCDNMVGNMYEYNGNI